MQNVGFEFYHWIFIFDVLYCFYKNRKNKFFYVLNISQKVSICALKTGDKMLQHCLLLCFCVFSDKFCFLIFKALFDSQRLNLKVQNLPIIEETAQKYTHFKKFVFLNQKSLPLLFQMFFAHTTPYQEPLIEFQLKLKLDIDRQFWLEHSDDKTEFCRSFLQPNRQ